MKSYLCGSLDTLIIMNECGNKHRCANNLFKMMISNEVNRDLEGNVVTISFLMMLKRKRVTKV